MNIAEKRQANKDAHDARDRKSDAAETAAEMDTDETPAVPAETPPS